MTTWDSYNKKSTPTSKQWDIYNANMAGKAYQQESLLQKKIDPKLFEQLRLRGNMPTDINAELAPKKVGFMKSLGQILGAGASGLYNQMLKTVRGSTQLLATPVAGSFAMLPGGVKPREAMKESLIMAKDMIWKEKVPFDQGVRQAADMYLKKYGTPNPKGGYQPTIGTVGALTALGLFNLLGDPVFEYGVGLKGAKALKAFATYKKVGQVKGVMPKGSSFIKGTTQKMEFKVGELKIVAEPKSNTLVIKGYQKRFSAQKALPEGNLSPETTDLIMSARESTGMNMTAKFVGDDLVLTPTTPIKTAQPIAKAVPQIKQSKLGVRIEQEAIEADLVKSMKDLPEYETINKLEQARLSADLINSDFNKAVRVGMGKEMPPEGLRASSVYTALKKYAFRKGDITLLNKLAKSHTVSQASFMGQEIRMLDAHDPTDPVDVIRSINELRAKTKKINVKESVIKEKAIINREIKAAVKSKAALEDFINSIKC